MGRLIAVVLALAVFVPLALAQPGPLMQVWPFDYNTYRQFDVGDIPAGDAFWIWHRTLIGGEETTTVVVPRYSWPRWTGNLLLGPPGHRHKTLPFAELWGFAVAESGVGWSATECDVQWRWRHWYPGDSSTIYHGAWTPAVAAITVKDTLYFGPLWEEDSLGWFNDIEFRALGGRGNDSTYLSFAVMRRTWK